MELTGGEMEGKDLLIIQHRAHDHSLVLRESLRGNDRYGGGGHQVYCDGCREPISSSSSSSGADEGRGAFYACPKANCWYLLHKRCAELPLKIEHPSDPGHLLTLRCHPSLAGDCHVCYSVIDGFRYNCSDCKFEVHVRCASMVLHIQDRVDENKKIHQHPLITIEMEAQFLCASCGREHKGKSYLCPTCGFWANQICASVPNTVDLGSHLHPLILLRSFPTHSQRCEICNEVVKRASWVYRCCDGCEYWVHVHCWLSLEETDSSNKRIQTNSHSTNPKKEIIRSWPLSGESAEVITELIKDLKRHKRGTKIRRCQQHNRLLVVNKKIYKSKDDQLCDGCGQTISSKFYHCPQCNFSLHKWCAVLPNDLQHILHPQHPLLLLTHKDKQFLPPRRRTCLFTPCSSCNMVTNGFIFVCFTCRFYLDLKCASLPRLVKHRSHDHQLVLRVVIVGQHSCNACGVDEFSTFFRCEACNFGLCIKCALLPISVRHRYDKHPFALTYSPIKGNPDEYYCEICEEDINSMYWFYHCIKCDQSVHPKCIYPIERYWNVKAQQTHQGKISFSPS